MWFLGGSSKYAKIYTVIIVILAFGYLAFLLVSCSNEPEKVSVIMLEPGRKVLGVSNIDHGYILILTEVMKPEDSPRHLESYIYFRQNSKWEKVDKVMIVENQ